MSGSSTGSLLLTTLLSIAGWIAVTLYTSDNTIEAKIQALDLRITTLEATQYKPDKLPTDSLLLLSSEIKGLEKDTVRFKERTLTELELLDRRVDMIIMQGISKSKKGN